MTMVDNQTAQVERNRHDAEEALANYDDDGLAFKAVIEGEEFTYDDAPRFLSLVKSLEGLGLDVDDLTAEAAHDALSAYGLSLEYDNGDREVRYVLATGGPHYEIRWTQDPRGQAKNVWFLAMPWFDRVELRTVGEGIEFFAQYHAQYIADCLNGVEGLDGYDPDWEPKGDGSEEDEPEVD